jgi:hypothetical protein
MRLSEICMQRGLASNSTNFLPRDWLCPFSGRPLFPSLQIVPIPIWNPIELGV